MKSGILGSMYSNGGNGRNMTPGAKGGKLTFDAGAKELSKVPKADTHEHTTLNWLNWCLEPIMASFLFCPYVRFDASNFSFSKD